MATHHADVVIVGGGTMGTAAGWAIARQGGSVAVLEQFDHVHGFGSHGGKTRIFRHAYAEGATYVPWALEADRLWTEVQERTGHHVHAPGWLHRCLGPGFPPGPGGPGQRRAIRSRPRVAHRRPRFSDRWPIWKIGDDREVCYGPDAGFLDAESACGRSARNSSRQAARSSPAPP